MNAEFAFMAKLLIVGVLTSCVSQIAACLVQR